MTAFAGGGARHAAHRHARHRVGGGYRAAARLPETRPLPVGGAHRPRHARRSGPDLYDRIVLAIAGWLLAIRIAFVGEQVIDEV
ncbi:hypothetical protein B7C42_01343 [Nocardia cerradoensis]|uniref:Uncharacterized protein n=1 Tax=Nocardia cerradoensis TaxID=85688 RepID=A0A231HCI7_9NOCA|nr:hypothetical protein [Nocardia cerradoensis]OXR46377.1 hypothetical protein B7C42_01343 [Nocardia cerradoensis]